MFFCFCWFQFWTWLIWPAVKRERRRYKCELDSGPVSSRQSLPIVAAVHSCLCLASRGHLCFYLHPQLVNVHKKTADMALISVGLRGRSAYAVCMQSAKPKMTQAYLSPYLRLAGCECVPAAKVLPANNENSNSQGNSWWQEFTADGNKFHSNSFQISFIFLPSKLLIFPALIYYRGVNLLL